MHTPFSHTCRAFASRLRASTVKTAGVTRATPWPVSIAAHRVSRWSIAASDVTLLASDEHDARVTALKWAHRTAGCPPWRPLVRASWRYSSAESTGGGANARRRADGPVGRDPSWPGRLSRSRSSSRVPSFPARGRRSARRAERQPRARRTTIGAGWPGTWAGPQWTGPHPGLALPSATSGDAVTAREWLDRASRRAEIAARALDGAAKDVHRAEIGGVAAAAVAEAAGHVAALAHALGELEVTKA
jgi:hypothetical protein